MNRLQHIKGILKWKVKGKTTKVRKSMAELSIAVKTLD